GPVGDFLRLNVGVVLQEEVPGDFHAAAFEEPACCSETVLFFNDCGGLADLPVLVIELAARGPRSPVAAHAPPPTRPCACASVSNFSSASMMSRSLSILMHQPPDPGRISPPSSGLNQILPDSRQWPRYRSMERRR